MENLTTEEIREYLTNRIKQDSEKEKLEKNSKLRDLSAWLEGKEYILECAYLKHISVYKMDLSSEVRIKQGKFVGRKILESFSLMSRPLENDEDNLENLSISREIENEKAVYFSQEGKFWNDGALVNLYESNEDFFNEVKELHTEVQSKLNLILKETYKKFKK